MRSVADVGSVRRMMDTRLVVRLVALLVVYVSLLFALADIGTSR